MRSKHEALVKIGNNIRAEMKRQDILTETFLLDTGINPGRLMSGRYNVCILTLTKVSDYLNVPLENLVK